MHGVPKRIENSGNVEIDIFLVTPDIRHRHGDVVRESSGPVHSDTLGARAQVTPPGEAVAAPSAHHVALGADDIALMKIGDVGPCLHNLADELVPYDHRHGNGALRPLIPVIDVQIGSADTGAEHADQDIVDADGGLGNILEPEPRLPSAFD